ncbi:hypothetical protein CU097_013416 [Rhizopus azygosporus]|uniref:Reverse transcriptase domain-containing protein n=1 Tax=Rhizopus azygosporus TaxID=86630 RepID=A0A367JW30_RHIAZ|nr:hypothetical protein CU097_013416 [Rhizopus azygosporus]
MPTSSRMYSSMPCREYEGLRINCPFYADDVVLIAAPEVMPRLLKKAEEHSVSLGYRWNPAKCVALNCPSIHGAHRLQLYGSPIPKADSFAYLGVPFDTQCRIAIDPLIAPTLPLPLPPCEEYFCPLGCVLPTSPASLPAVYM